MSQPDNRSPHSADNIPMIEQAGRGEVVAVPIMSLRPGDSPRLDGEDRHHIARLAETEAPLPPILVHRRTMRVIDGAHRLMAASLQDRETIDVVFFEGSEAEAFLRAVQENVIHGLPLTKADRRAAAERIIASHPRMSDRTIGYATGLDAKTVAVIRKRSTEGGPQSNARVGKDGRIRPLDTSEARRRAAELMTARPDAPLREIAHAVGISPATVLDVRKRLARGEPAVVARAASGAPSGGDAPAAEAGHGSCLRDSRRASRLAARPGTGPDPAATVAKLLRDPSLRNNDRGKGILRLLHINAVGGEQLPGVVGAVPPHCVAIVVQLSRQYAQMWLDFASELDGRARIIDPSA